MKISNVLAILLINYIWILINISDEADSYASLLGKLGLILVNLFRKSVSFLMGHMTNENHLLSEEKYQLKPSNITSVLY